MIRKLWPSSTLVFTSCWYSTVLGSACISASSFSSVCFLNYPRGFGHSVLPPLRRHPHSIRQSRRSLSLHFPSSIFVDNPSVASNKRRRILARYATLLSSSSSSSTMTEIRTFERSITCSDGVRLAMKCWRNFDHDDDHDLHVPPHRKILCLHGWLDNAASFDRLAPRLLRSLSRGTEANDGNNNDDRHDGATEIIALDFPGHGLSDHKSPDGPPQLLAEYAYYAVEFLDAVGWGAPFEDDTRSTATSFPPRDKVTIVGHSMGAGVAVVLAASFPEGCASLVLLEGAGPLSRNAEDAPRHVRAACRRRMRSNRLLFPTTKKEEEGTSPPSSNFSSSFSRAKIYESIDAAIEARLDTARRMPGDQYLSAEAARDMVLRATVPAAVVNTADTSSSSSPSSTTSNNNPPSTPVTFRHDPRLQWPSLQYYTREQVEAFYRSVARPVCLLSAEDGWPVDARAEAAVTEVLRPEYARRLTGSHHFHADPDTVGEVVEHIVRFLEERGL